MPAPALAADLADAPALLTPVQLAKLLDVPPRSLEHWRASGRGPRFHRVGKHVRYARSAVLAWLRENEAGNVAESRAARDGAAA